MGAKAIHQSEFEVSKFQSLQKKGINIQVIGVGLNPNPGILVWSNRLTVHKFLNRLHQIIIYNFFCLF